MANSNRVIWSDGLFIKPQHFQQQQRYLEQQIHQRSLALCRSLYGFTALTLNDEYLGFGRIALVNGAGLFADGTAFDLLRDDVMPQPLEITGASVANQLVYLALPLHSNTQAEICWPEESAVHSRFQAVRMDIRDLHTTQGDTHSLDLARVAPRLMLGSDDLGAYSTLAIGRILEQRANGSLVMDANFIPTLLDTKASPRLQRFVEEIASLMQERARNIADRVGAPGHNGVAEVTDFLLLQLMNRSHPRFLHLSRLPQLHPQALYEALLELCAELVTFTDQGRVPPPFVPYSHDLPEACFSQLIQLLRQSLSTVLEPQAMAISLQERQFGLTVAPLHDSGLIGSAEFILAVKADMPQDDLRSHFVQQCKVASVEKIGDLISLQLPGVPLVVLPAAPRQLPYHAGYVYFQLDDSSQAWQMLENASGFAFHVAGDFPALEMQFWAIRR